MKATLTGPSAFAFTVHTPNVLVEIDGAQVPTIPGPVQPPPVTPTEPSEPTGYDLNTSAALLEAWNNKLDPIGAPDAVVIGPLGHEPSWHIWLEGFERSNSCYRWTAGLVAPVDGEYEFKAEVKSGGSIHFDNELIWAVDREGDATSFPTGFVVEFKRTLTKGHVYPLKAHVSYQGLLFFLTVDWKRPGQEAFERISTPYLHPPADWQARLKTYMPPPPKAPVMTVPDAAYRSPELALSFPGPWSTPIDQEPVDPLSDAIIARLGTLRLHPVFGPGVGIPFEVVPEGSLKVRIQFDYAGESDPGPYPLPERPVVESGGGDGHWIGVDPAEKLLFELFLVRKEGGTWLSGSGAIFDLTTGLRVSGSNPGWTSADAAGLPILPGLVRPDEVLAGEINHALRISVPATRAAYIAPATHLTHPNDPARKATDLPPMGCRLRLKASVDESTFPTQCRPIVLAAKKYGFIVADNGSNFLGLCGCPDGRWRDDELAALKTIKADSFEVVRMGEITESN